jgi:hypothetical protein
VVLDRRRRDRDGRVVRRDGFDEYFVLETVIISAQGPDSTLAAALGRDVKGKISPVIDAVAIPLAFVNRWIAVGLYVLVSFMWLFPTAGSRRRSAAPSARRVWVDRPSRRDPVATRRAVAVSVSAISRLLVHLWARMTGRPPADG